MFPNRARIALALACTLLVGALVGAATGGDAGSGGDAGDTIDDATALPGPGTYAATLENGGDDDWYLLPLPDTTGLSSAHVCTIATATGTDKAAVTLTDGPGGPAVTNVMDGDGAPLVLAGHVNPDVYLGFEPFYVLGLPQDYAFTIETRTIDDLGWPDAGTGRDAGDTRATATPVDDPCITGIIQAGDGADVYAFDAPAGALLLLSADQIGDTLLRVDLLAPDGSLVESIVTHDALTTTLDEAGTWFVQVAPASGASTSSTSPSLTFEDVTGYVLGIEVDEKPTRPPCKPSCLTSS